MISQHQVQPIKNLKPEFHCDKGRCSTCKLHNALLVWHADKYILLRVRQKTPAGLLLQHNTDKTSGEEEENLLLCPESDANPPPDIVSESDSEPDPTSYNFY